MFQNLLQVAFIDFRGDPDSKTLTIVIKSFSELSKELNQNNGTLSFDALSKFQNALDTNLYGKPPMSVSLKTATYAVIGALAGLTLGLIVGASLLLCTGGVGTIGAAVLGAFKGYSLALSLTCGISLATSAAVIGSKSATRSNQTFFDRKNEINRNNQSLVSIKDSIFQNIKGQCCENVRPQIEGMV